ncbi:antitoxin component YwqK of YwqJK toxin-antitoxin module [Variovorax boronicumulans]|nr:antitoxin component YwqK of YwqJK toxin-antitoxin module [Variovorax boronicumulans]
MLEVSFDDLEPSDDHSILEYKGAPFTGLAVENGEAGRRIAETPYVDGQRCGTAREWSATGRLLSEQSFLLNSLHGQARTWFEDGKSKSDATYELGICVVKREWDVEGALTSDYCLTESDPQFKTLRRLRELYGRARS